MAFRTAAASDPVGAAASFHGGGLVPNSPHLQAAKTKAAFLVAIAENDDKCAPKDKDVLKETFAAGNLSAEIEVYVGAAHGWCPPRKPRRRGVGCWRCTESFSGMYIDESTVYVI